MPLRDDLLNPIPGANPSGENLRYAPVYDQIKEARREEEEIAQGAWQHERKKADWPLVIKLAGEALAKKSKDLQLAAWLTEAMLRKEGFQGLREGLDLLRNLVETFWDTLYPEVEDGDLEMRATPIEWVGSKLEPSIRLVALTKSNLDFRAYKDSRSVPYETDAAKADQRAQAINDGKLTPEEFDEAVAVTPRSFYEERMAQLDACVEAARALQTLCEEKFPDEPPDLGGLVKGLEPVKQFFHVTLKKKEPEQGAAAPEEDGAAEAGGDEGEAVDSGSGAAAAPARARKRAAGPLAAEPVDKDDAIARVLGAARWLRQNDAYSPAPYLLVRALRWGELRAGAPEPDATLMEPPATEVRQEIKRLFGEGSYQQALDAAENAIGEPCGRAWLDVQRYAVQCCEYMGYSAAAAAIKSELKALLADIPGLMDRSLMDDTPTANAETRQWIQEQVAPPAAAADAAPAMDWYSQPAAAPQPQAEQTDGTPAPRDPFDVAMESVRAGDARGAIELLSREAAQARCGRDRFNRSIQLAQVCLGSNHGNIAFPILESIAEQIERRKLEEWEAPDTLAHAFTLLLHAAKSKEITAEERQKLFNRICRLDPVQALGLSR